jgi:hypothetical protein
MKTNLLLLPFLFLVACTEIPRPDGARFGPVYYPANTSSTSPNLPKDLHRVLVLTPADTTTDRILTAEAISDLHRVILSTLTHSARFELIPLSHRDLAIYTQGQTLNSTAPIPSGIIEQLAQNYQAQGILFTDITNYSPYPPLQLGLRTKLARIDNLQILWASDTNFSAADSRVANSARKFAKKHSTNREAGDLSYVILQNPSRFAEYASSTLFETLPVR